MADLNAEKESYISLECCQKIVAGLDYFGQMFLLSIARHDGALENMIIRNFAARCLSTLHSIVVLYTLGDYQNCWVLYRCLLERLFTMIDLKRTDSFLAFKEYCFVEDYEIRNRIRSDQSFSARLDRNFWKDSLEHQTEYARLKKKGVSWRRPKPEDVAKDMELPFLYKHGYDYASIHVHPMGTDGQADFFRLTGLTRAESEPNQIVVVINSCLTTSLMFWEGMNCSTVKWVKLAYDVISNLQHALRDEQIDVEVPLKQLHMLFTSRNNSFCEP